MPENETVPRFVSARSRVEPDSAVLFAITRLPSIALVSPVNDPGPARVTVPFPVLVREPVPEIEVKEPTLTLRSASAWSVGEPVVPNTKPMLPPVPVTPLMVRFVVASKLAMVPPLKLIRRTEAVQKLPVPALISAARSSPAESVYCALNVMPVVELVTAPVCVVCPNTTLLILAFPPR